MVIRSFYTSEQNSCKPLTYSNTVHSIIQVISSTGYNELIAGNMDRNDLETFNFENGTYGTMIWLFCMCTRENDLADLLSLIGNPINAFLSLTF